MAGHVSMHAQARIAFPALIWIEKIQKKSFIPREGSRKFKQSEVDSYDPRVSSRKKKNQFGRDASLNADFDANFIYR